MRKEKKKNKGFTLVELIIVVAVIAVLAAVLAPQYLQYVERSREANDVQVATSIMRATTTAMNDPQNKVPSGELVEVTWHTNSNPGALGGMYPGVGAISIDAVDESGNVQHSSALANQGADGWEVHDRFRYAISLVMGLIPESALDHEFEQPGFASGATQAESAVGVATDFVFTINTSTGEFTNITPEWVALGVQE